MNIEVEIRSFVTKERFEELLQYFKANAKHVKEDKQETHYFKGDHDLRIQKNQFFSKVWLKKGKFHDDYREEIEIKFDKESFAEISKLFDTLGYGIRSKWLRIRNTFEWEGIGVMLDDTRGFGYVIELEKMSNEEDVEKNLEMLKEKLKSLNVPLTPKVEFDKQFDYYNENWEKLF